MHKAVEWRNEQANTVQIGGKREKHPGEGRKIKASASDRAHLDRI